MCRQPTRAWLQHPNSCLNISCTRQYSLHKCTAGSPPNPSRHTCMCSGKGSLPPLYLSCKSNKAHVQHSDGHNVEPTKHMGPTA